MSAKRVFFGALQKIMVICCAIFFGFANAFSANLPAGYTELEYVTFDGTNSTGAYVDTGLKYYTDIPNTKIRLVADAKVYQGTGWQVVVGNTGSYTAYVGTNSGNNLYYCVGTNDTSTNVQNPYKRLLFDLNAPAKTLTIKNVETNTNIVNLSNISVAEKTNVLPVMLGAYHSGSSVSTQRAHMDLYSVKIYNNGTLVFDGVPAKYGNTVGIYDLVRGSFKSSASTALTAGPAVLNPCRNLFDGEYISVSSGAKAENKNPFYVTPGKKYTISWSGSTPAAVNLYAYDSNNTVLYSWTSSSGTAPYFSDSHNAWYNGATFTVPENVVRLRFNTFGSMSAAQQASWAASLQIEEGSTATGYVPYSAACHNGNPIKIATTAYNAARFNPVQTDLNNAVATIREIVTKTINQTAAIASLQADKQTRPEDACPAGKKCLLVETEENGVIVPHWYPIIENIYGLPAGYTALEYIQSTGTQYIDTGVVFDSGSLKFETDVYVTANITSEEDFIGNFTGSTLTAGFVGGFANITFLYSSSPNVNVPRIKQNSWQKYIGEFTNSNQMILTYDGTTVSATRTKQHNSSPIVLFRGSESYKPASHIRLGIVSIYLNNTMVRNFVPAKRNSDGAIGMYDLTNPNPATAFYTNSGTGTFTAGPEI